MRKLLTFLALFATIAVQGAQIGKHLNISLRQENIPVEQAKQSFSKWMKLDDKTTFKLKRDETDELGYRHQHYDQYYNARYVDGAHLIVHSKDGKLTHVNGFVFQFDAASARQVPRRVSIPGKEVVLVITADGIFNAVKGFDPVTKDIIYTDVATGRIVKREPTTFYFDGQRKVKAETYYHGEREMDVTQLADGRYVMADSVRKIFTYDAAGVPDTIPQKYCNDKYPDESGNMIACPDSANCKKYFDDMLKLAQTKRDAFKMQELSPLKLDLTAAGKQAVGSCIVGISCGDVTIELIDVTLPLTIKPEETQSVKDYMNYIRMNDTDTTLVVLSDMMGNPIDALQIIPTADGGDVPSQKVEGVGKCLTAEATLKACGNYAADAHWGIQQVYDFYKQVLGRNSYDNCGSRIVNVVNPVHATEAENPILNMKEPNAFASIYDMPRMVYGRGDMTGKFDEVVELSTMGHEFTHLVTWKTADLQYIGESGALNEAFSDILGIAIFHHVLNSDGKLPLDYVYSMGQDCTHLSKNGYIRLLKNPWKTESPKAIEGRYWKNPLEIGEGKDYGGVHTNSNVLGFWFYLLSEGFQPARDTLDHTVVSPAFIQSVQTDGWKGIGIDRATKLAYHLLAHYLYQKADFRVAYNLSKVVALDLGYGEDSEEYQTLMKCWRAISPEGWTDAAYLDEALAFSFDLKTVKEYKDNLSVLADYDGTQLRSGIVEQKLTVKLTDPDKLRSLAPTVPKYLPADFYFSTLSNFELTHHFGDSIKQFISKVLADATLPAGYSQSFVFTDTINAGGKGVVTVNIPTLQFQESKDTLLYEAPATFIKKGSTTLFSNSIIQLTFCLTSGFPMLAKPDLVHGESVTASLYYIVEEDGDETLFDRQECMLEIVKNDVFNYNKQTYYIGGFDYKYPDLMSGQAFGDTLVPEGTYRLKLTSSWGALMPATFTITVLNPTGIRSLQPASPDALHSGAWYTLDGRRLTGEPTTKGLYIHNGQKVVRTSADLKD